MPDCVKCFSNIKEGDEGGLVFQSALGEGFLEERKMILAGATFAEAVLVGGEEVVVFKV